MFASSKVAAPVWSTLTAKPPPIPSSDRVKAVALVADQAGLSVPSEK
jgi:hypothetical protein